MIALFALLLLQLPRPTVPQQGAVPQQVQMGVAVRPDTVTVGQHFLVTLRVRAPLGTTVDFPAGPDSAARVQRAEPMRRNPGTDSRAVDVSAVYELAAWDIGRQPLMLGDVVLRTASGERRAATGDVAVYVRSVLPADTTLRVPRPPRSLIIVPQFNWWPWIIAAAVLVASALSWFAWVAYRRRRHAPLAPFAWAEREFERIEAMHLLQTGEPERYAVLMAGVLREYLAREVAGVRHSATTREVAAVLTITPTVPAEQVLRLFDQTDLVKFARLRLTDVDAQNIGNGARAIVRTVHQNTRAAAAPVAA